MMSCLLPAGVSTSSHWSVLILGPLWWLCGRGVSLASNVKPLFHTSQLMSTLQEDVEGHSEV